ncbi:mitochondrial fission process protein 1 [Willisornis vidua]|uniref:Mitochondrial fission process protein 1 n=1 Tax=Willisornis vidua TaxID=1566151 RepID=A0ABQ9DFD2_9PASS|nr:mitochondrial fission process protein 1 [Willisornis vidua]
MLSFLLPQPCLDKLLLNVLEVPGTQTDAGREAWLLQEEEGSAGYYIAHLKGFYANAHSMNSKQEELKALAQSLRFDITNISETWWDESCDWTALLDSRRLFRSDRQGTRGGGDTLYVIEGYKCMELTVGNGTAESLCVRIKEQTNNMAVIVGVYYYRPPSQDDGTDELHFEELSEISK